MHSLEMHVQHIPEQCDGNTHHNSSCNKHCTRWFLETRYCADQYHEATDRMVALLDVNKDGSKAGAQRIRVRTGPSRRVVNSDTAPCAVGDDSSPAQRTVANVLQAATECRTRHC